MLSLNCTDELDMTRLERGKNASPTSNTGNNTELESKRNRDCIQRSYLVYANRKTKTFLALFLEQGL